MSDSEHRDEIKKEGLNYNIAEFFIFSFIIFKKSL